MLTFKEAPEEISIIDEEGNPLLAGDEDRRYFEGPWVHKYKFYHDCTLSGGVDNKRCVKFTELKYNEDGTIKTVEL